LRRRRTFDVTASVIILFIALLVQSVANLNLHLDSLPILSNLTLSVD
jgi:hypothetical protein